MARAGQGFETLHHPLALFLNQLCAKCFKKRVDPKHDRERWHTATVGPNSDDSE